MRRQLVSLALLGVTLEGAAAELELGGRLQMDRVQFAGVYSRDGQDHRVGYLRRAELEASLPLRQGWRLTGAVAAEGDGRVRVPEAWIGWATLPGLTLRAGRIDPDFGLEPSTSSNWTLGIERAALWDLAPDVADAGDGRGLRADAHGPGWHLSLGHHDKRDHAATVARAVWMPRTGGAGVWQIGGSVATSHGWAGDGRLRSRLAVRGVTEDPAGRRTTLAGAAAFDRDHVWGLEGVLQHGPWMLQAEGLLRTLSGTAGAPARKATGTSLQAAWAWAGQPRRHDERRARFGRPRDGAAAWGHWESFARLDVLAARPGLAAQVWTLGTAWTAPRGDWRAALNLHQARSEDSNAAGDSRGVAWSMRLQAAF